jgi:zinc transporter 1/2/3
MLNDFQLFSLVSILVVAAAGGYWPLFRSEQARTGAGFPLGQAFAAGVFLALSLVIMLPNGFHLFRKALPQVTFPLASLPAAGAFVALLAVGHMLSAKRSSTRDAREITTALIPVIMTISIAIPSFLLGTALGVSDELSGIAIWFAVVAHKGSAGFALALSMVRSTMTRAQTFMLFGLFAVSTPLGIFFGADVHDFLSGHTMLLVKAVILSLAAGVFLFMATLHEMKHAPLIVDCCTKRGFVAMFIGLVLTILVRVLLGVAHTGHVR